MCVSWRLVVFVLWWFIHIVEVVQSTEPIPLVWHLILLWVLQVNRRLQVQLSQGDNSEANRILVLSVRIDCRTFQSIFTNSLSTNHEMLDIADWNLLYII
jgi:hypothetical protein